MSTLDSLKAARNLGDVARLVGFTPSKLAYVLYKQPAAMKYTSFEIPKRNGGKRVIEAPGDALKLVQERLSALLQDCLDEIGQTKGRKDRIAHGFKRRRSIITNARRHRNRKYVFNLDLKEFFPSINFGRVRGFFLKDHSFALHEGVATVLAQIACNNNAIPQGSPCSPVISNLVAHVLDVHLVRLASKAGCTYSRYADDLTFSTNRAEFPSEIAFRSAPDAHTWEPGDELKAIIKHSGFEINPVKTRMQHKHSRQEVTGLVVNKKINVRREYRHAVRAMVHSLLTKGSFESLRPARDTSGVVLTTKKAEGTLNQLHGMLGFVDSIDLYNKKNAGASSKELGVLSKKELMYQDFLIYRDFWAAETPVVICEGETDNIYLIHAIRSLAATYPELAATGQDGKITLRVRLYKYPHSSTARILGLRDGGSDPLSKFIRTFSRKTKKFKAPGGQKHPVILLYDNDAGASPIRKAVKEVSGQPPSGHETFTRVFGNLYAVPTPLMPGVQESKIEDFFDSAVKTTLVDGKQFCDSNDFDIEKYYGKKIFAHKVVRPMAESIDFQGFGTLLSSIAAVIKEHRGT